jgi:hypothetical protein
MKTLTSMIVCLVLLCGVSFAEEKKAEKAAVKAEKKATELCKGCGQVKGAPKCCDKTAKRCGCGMIKGAPGCCKMPKDLKGPATLCGCGQIKGTPKCCDKKAKRCACGKIKGSPGCCLK